ncbi:MAG: hypothetical protein CEE38_05920 [Planctomycetes bacterium B3_Pla]|nr:MAG: hypothetical protein CEE38_05920 [Planctomycetes bacterium B3_Pla]
MTLQGAGSAVTMLACAIKSFSGRNYITARFTSKYFISFMKIIFNYFQQAEIFEDCRNTFPFGYLRFASCLHCAMAGVASA